MFLKNTRLPIAVQQKFHCFNGAAVVSAKGEAGRLRCDVRKRDD